MSTSGKTLVEGELRAFAKCSEFYHRGGLVKENFGTLVVKGAVERLIIQSLRKGISEPLKDIEAALLDSLAEVNQKDSMLTPQITKYMHACLLWLKEFFEVIPFDKYEPVFGPIRPKIKVSNTPIELSLIHI